jgi:hypothetical protein
LRAKVVLGAGFGVFVVVIAALLTPTVRQAKVETFLPRAAGVAVPPGPGIDTVTVDAGAENRWRYVDLERGRVSDPPDTAGWDLRFQRFHVIPSGTIANLGPIPFDSVRVAPDTGYIQTSTGRDTVNAATARWYSYSYFSHLLHPKGDVYVLRTREGHTAKMQIVGYYCPGPTPGCTTFRWAFIGD